MFGECHLSRLREFDLDGPLVPLRPVTDHQTLVLQAFNQFRGGAGGAPKIRGNLVQPGRSVVMGDELKNPDRAMRQIGLVIPTRTGVELGRRNAQTCRSFDRWIVFRALLGQLDFPN